MVAMEQVFQIGETVRKGNFVGDGFLKNLPCFLPFRVIGGARLVLAYFGQALALGLIALLQLIDLVDLAGYQTEIKK